MSVSIPQSTFTAGEWSPSLHSRTDLAKYAAACKTMRNFYPHPHGGASNRQGTDFVVRTKDSSKVSRLYPFQFSVTQGYIIEFGDLYVRFIKDGGQITSTKTITGATNATPISITATAHGFSTGNTVTIIGVGGNTAANGTWIITKTGANTFTLDTSVGNGVYTSGGSVTAIVEIVTTYAAADLALLKFEQSADTLYIAHPSYPRRKLTRTSHTDWTISTIAGGASVTTPVGLSMAGTGRFFAVTAVDANQNESIPSASEEGAPSNTLSWTAVSGAVEYRVYEVKDATYQFVTRTMTNSWVAPATVTPDPDIGAPAATSKFGSTDNYPGCVAFFEQRLLYARTNTKPQTFNGSVVGDFENNNISTPVQADDAYEFTINSGQVNEIRWMAALTDLIIGTSGSEWKLIPGGNTDSVTPSSAKLVRQSRWGVSHVPPIIIGDSILFVDGSTKKVRDLFYALQRDGYDGSDLTILAQHLFLTYGIKEWSYQQHPNSIIWCVRTDGNLTGLTYQKEHQVYGWHRHDTDGNFESVATISNNEGESETYFIIKRTIDNATVRYVERLHTRDFLDIEDAFFVDCGLTYDGSVNATLTPGTGADVQGTEDVVFTAGSGIFVVGDVGREIHYRYAVVDEDPSDGETVYHTAYAEITEYTSATQIKATIKLPFPALTAISVGAWRMSVNTFSGLGHLEGETLVALADGSVIEDLEVESGVVTFPNAVSKVHIGLPYTCDLENLPFDFPTRSGTVQDKQRTINSLIARFRDTRECFVGPDSDNLEEVAFRDTEGNGEPTALHNGDKEVFITAGQPRRGNLFIRTVNPLPCTIQALIGRIDSGSK